MPKIICVECGLEMPTARIGITVVEMAHYPPTPYKSWSADLQQCKHCGHRVAGKFALETFEHQEGFWEGLKNTPEELLVVVWERTDQTIPPERAREYLLSLIKKVDDG